MANAYRTNDLKKDYESIEDYIFSFCPQFGIERYMDHEESDGNKYYPTSYFEEETAVHRIHEEYDWETFWDLLAEHLGERDFLEKYSKKDIKAMSREEYFEKISQCIDSYGEEFEKFGIKRLKLDNHN